MILLGILQFVAIAGVTVYEFKLKSPAVYMWATLSIMFGVMHMWNSFSGDYIYADAVMIEASMFVVIFCFFYLSVRLMNPRRIKKKTKEVFRYNHLEKMLRCQRSYCTLLLMVFIATMALKLIPYIRYVGNIFSSSWSTGRDYSASLGYINSEQFARILMYSLSGLSIIMMIKNDKRWVIVASLILFCVILTRNRIEILPLFCSVIAIFLYKKNRLNMKIILLAVLGGISIIYIVYALRVFRHYGTVQNFVQNFELNAFNDKIMQYLATDNGELGLRRDFYFFIDGDNEFEGFGQLHSYIRMLLVYVPTSWSFGLKPDDFAITMGAAMGMAEGGSTHPTLFGDCYANLGFAGISLGFFWGLYANIVDLIIVKRKHAYIQILMYALNAVVYVIIARGSIYNGFWFVAYGMPFLILLELLLSKVRLLKNKMVCVRLK